MSDSERFEIHDDYAARMALKSFCHNRGDISPVQALVRSAVDVADNPSAPIVFLFLKADWDALYPTLTPAVVSKVVGQPTRYLGYPVWTFDKEIELTAKRAMFLLDGIIGLWIHRNPPAKAGV